MSRASTAWRRVRTISALVVGGGLLTLAAPVLLVVAVVVDLVRGQRRLPVARLLGCALGWVWLELAGVVAAAGLFLAGRAGDHPVHYRLQAWWAERLMGVLRGVGDVHVEVGSEPGDEALDERRPGPVILLSRHAHLADSLITAWLVASRWQRHPRVVLKAELLADPCLDIVGNRLPNVFVDRGAADSGPALAQLRAMAVGMGEHDVAVIFPEGTRATARKRRAAADRLAASDPARAARLAPLRHLLPPRPSGTLALLEAAPGADVVVAVHVGLEGLHTIGAMLAAIGRGPLAVTVRTWPVDRPEDGEDPAAWLDEQWLSADRQVDAQLASRAR